MKKLFVLIPLVCSLALVSCAAKPLTPTVVIPEAKSAGIPLTQELLLQVAVELTTKCEGGFEGRHHEQVQTFCFCLAGQWVRNAVVIIEKHNLKTLEELVAHHKQIMPTDIQMESCRQEAIR